MSDPPTDAEPATEPDKAPAVAPSAAPAAASAGTPDAAGATHAAEPVAELAATLDFLREAGRLKDVLRSAHSDGGRRESTAEHSWRLCLWVVALDARLGDVDRHRLLELAVVHDLGEALGGDTPAPLQHADPDRQARERRDLHALSASLPPPAAARIRALWEEYEAGETPEARLAKGLDKLETMLQHTHGANPPGFDYAFNLDYGRERTDAHPLTAALRELVDAATRRRRDG